MDMQDAISRLKSKSLFCRCEDCIASNTVLEAFAALEAVVREKCEDCSYLKSFPVAQEEITRLETEVQEKDAYNRKLLDENIDFQNENAAQRGEIAVLTAESAKYREALEEAAPFVCSAMCPSSKRTGTEWTHATICRRVQAALKPTEGGSK
jgi:hypothetical protein